MPSFIAEDFVAVRRHRDDARPTVLLVFGDEVEVLETRDGHTRVRVPRRLRSCADPLACSEASRGWESGGLLAQQPPFGFEPMGDFLARRPALLVPDQVGLVGDLVMGWGREDRGQHL